MTINVNTAQDFASALDLMTKAKVDDCIAAVQREAAVYCFQQWTSGKFTWSKWQPEDVWSGQSRASVNVSVGAPDPTYAPDNPGDWPIHGSPYGPRDPFEARFRLESMQPYSVVWVTDNAPHAAKVEAFTRVAHMAAKFTTSHFAPGYNWSGVVNKSQSVPF